ncbi:hypothetical protein Apmu_0033_07 [Acidiphilium multivorum AIU301]|nr:hypothetical protein Apmu_0033_07 [Acidiphilium multivorum AIU301]
MLNLAGNSGTVPARHEMFLGKVKLVGQTADQAHVTFNKETGQLDTRQLKHVAETVTPDGQKMLQITLDERDKDQLPKIIARERKRRGLPPLSEEQLASQTNNFTTTTVDHPLIQINQSISFAFLRHAMMKIAYELAFLWLGELYLDDPVAAELRTAICSPELTSTDKIAGYVGVAEDCDAFKCWTPHEEHHLAYANVVAGNVMISVRVFDIYAACIVVSREAGRYFQSHAHDEKLRFLAIDAVSGKTVETSFGQETQRIATAMTAFQRLPPFWDPL